MTNIPIIDFQKFTTNSDKERLRIAEELDWAASKVGFMYVKNLGIDPAVLDAAFASSRAFFSQPQEIKNRSGYYQEINHGYQASEQQRLDSQIAPDLKEAFTMRDVPKNRNRPEIWPSPEFYKTAKTAFDEFLRGANIVMEAFAIALDLPIDFFRECHQGDNTALRYLHYPVLDKEPTEDQLGCGAHTDFGTITLLFQDDVGGLQVKGRDGIWHDAIYIPETIIINTADLVASWTNDRYCSTPHRVKPMNSNTDRYSIAFFVDPDAATPISTFSSCITKDNPHKYPDTTAGAYVAQRIAYSNKLAS
tara:strand:- start:76 stop:993 length:918 start_codon:yes stop_codon:yes gene_type:complete